MRSPWFKSWVICAVAMLWHGAVLADPLDDILAGQGDPRAALAGIVLVDGKANEAPHIAVRGCARFADDGRTCQLPLNENHVVRVASISKLVTAIGVMRLVERGRLDLDRDVSRYLGFPLRNPAFPKRVITLRQLLSHTSSLRDSDVYWAEFPDTLQSLFQTTPAHFDQDHAPGTFFAYTNLNYGVVATIVERVTGVRFDRYMKRKVFDPLKITAGYNWSGLTDLPGNRVVTLYRKSKLEGPWEPQLDDFKGQSPTVIVRAKPNASYDLDTLPIGTNGTLFAPQGGLRIAVSDLAKIAQLLAQCGTFDGHRLLRCRTVRQMMTPVWQYRDKPGPNGASEGGFFTQFGLGAQQFTIAPSATVFSGHYAEAYGLRGGMLINPVRHTYGFYLFTGTASDPAALPSDVPGLSVQEAALARLLLPHLE